MEAEKLFVIDASKQSTAVTVGKALGRILQRPEVSDFVRGYGSEVKRAEDFYKIDIVPPLPRNQLNKLGHALVDLATNLDPTPPAADYRINKIS